MGIPSTCWCRRLRRHRLILGLGISPKEGNGKLLQYSCLENTMDRGAWWAMGCRIAEQDSTESDLALSSVQLLHLVWQHLRFPCPSPTPRVHSNSYPLCWWCHPNTLSSVIPFSSCLQSFPASGSFPVSQFFASGGQSTAVSASASVLPMNIQDWFHLGLTGSISLQSKGLSRCWLWDGSWKSNGR